MSPIFLLMDGLIKESNFKVFSLMYPQEFVIVINFPAVAKSISLNFRERHFIIIRLHIWITELNWRSYRIQFALLKKISAICWGCLIKGQIISKFLFKMRVCTLMAAVIWFLTTAVSFNLVNVIANWRGVLFLLVNTHVNLIAQIKTTNISYKKEVVIYLVGAIIDITCVRELIGCKIK